ncbi:MAG: hypothetical protein NTY07_06055 [Bacteroidia bacterium]|nr:hypothetical protein [Bacteroidia bacterium]
MESNFKFLSTEYPILANLGILAEKYIHDDPNGDSLDLMEQIKQAKAGLEKGGRTKKMNVDDEVRMVADEGMRYGK